MADASSSSGATLDELPPSNAKYEPKNFRDWTAEEVNDYFRKLCDEFKIAFHESSRAMTGSEFCALDETSSVEFLGQICFQDGHLGRAVYRLGRLIAATQPQSRFSNLFLLRAAKIVGRPC